VVGKTDDVVDDTQMQDIGALVPFVTEDADGIEPVPAGRRGEGCVAASATVGQHSEDVLREAGYSADDVGRLRKLGVLA
jgi:formyl-CoA transferase